MATSEYPIGGVGATPTLEDVLKIATGQPVSLDAAAASKIKKGSPPPASYKPEELAEGAVPSASEDWPELTALQARAAIVVRTLSLVNGNSRVRLSVVEALVNILNSGTTPQLRGASYDKGLLQQLADNLAGTGGSAVLEPPGISAEERTVLEAGQSASAGIAALVVAAGRSTVSAASAVAALSSEALQAQTKAFEDAAGEGQAYKATASVAGDLRGLLEGSSRVNLRKGGAGAVRCILAVPQVHGAAEAALSAAAAAVRSELAAAAPAPDKVSQEAPPLQLAEAVLSLGRCLLAVAAKSIARCELNISELSAIKGKQTFQALMVPVERLHLAQQRLTMTCSYNYEYDGDDGCDGVPCLAAALSAATALEAVQEAIALEAALAVICLRAQEGPVSPESTEGAPAKEDPAAKKKDKKKSKGAGFTLGKGTAMWRAFLEQAAGAQVADLAAQIAKLSLGDGTAAGEAANGAAPEVAVQLCAAVKGVSEALNPTEKLLAPYLSSVRAVLEANAARRKPKIAKGARDFLPAQMTIRRHAFRIIERCFARHGAVAIDTPVFELRETLMGKYGEDSKLIYDLADQGGEILSLRYDLTVPFARYVALNGLGNIKRYHIARVYRRDQPQAARGRFREFFQCDFDIAGAYPSMVPDAEVLKVVVEILSELDIGAFRIKLNHRKILDAMMRICGVPASKFRAICSAIDKLDKEPWAAVRAEMVDQKGLAPEAADRIQQFVEEAGEPRALLAKLSAPGYPLAADPEAAAALAEMAVLFDLLGSMGNALDFIRFDLSLARGLDYYTGLIYEVVLVPGPDSEATENVGSIAAGGRYDGLVGMFSGKDVPAVGVSIGIERVFAILERRLRQQAQQHGASIRETQTQVLVASPGKGMQLDRIQLASELWDADIAAEFGYKANPNFKDSLQYADDEGIPFLVILGESEKQEGIVRLKNMWSKGEGDDKGDAVKREDVVAVLKEHIAALGSGDALLTKQGPS